MTSTFVELPGACHSPRNMEALLSGLSLSCAFKPYGVSTSSYERTLRVAMLGG